MSDDLTKTPRMVVARRSLLLGAAGTMIAAPLFASGEGGEGGEGAAAADLPPRVEAVVMIGLFDASVRIVAELYAAGDIAEAQDQFAGSHHAQYGDVAPLLDRLGIEGFAPLSEAFATAVQAGAEPADVAARHAALHAAILPAYAAATPVEIMQASQRLLRVAHDDFYAGTYEGEVTSPHEYRDAWGFSTVAGERLAALAASDDPTVAAAGARAHAAMVPVRDLFPGLMATEVPGEPSVLAGAAARVEIAALQLD